MFNFFKRKPQPTIAELVSKLSVKLDNVPVECLNYRKIFVQLVEYINKQLNDKVGVEKFNKLIGEDTSFVLIDADYKYKMVLIGIREDNNERKIALSFGYDSHYMYEDEDVDIDLIISFVSKLKKALSEFLKTVMNKDKMELVKKMQDLMKEQ